MTMIGLMSYYLGINVRQGKDDIFISHESYAKSILEMFNMKSRNPKSIPGDYAFNCPNIIMEVRLMRYISKLYRSLCYLTCMKPYIL